MSGDRYPFGPIADEPRKVRPWSGGDETPGRRSRIPEPRLGPQPPAPGVVGPQQPGDLEPGLAPAPAVPAPVGQAAPTGMAPDVRQDALARLLGRAEMYGDRGDSTKTITDLLMGVDMGRAGRASGMWDARNAGLAASGEQYLAGTADALKAQRAKRASGSGSRSGGGGGGSSSLTQMGLTPADYQWLDQYMLSLTPPSSTPRYAAPTVKRIPTPSGNGARYVTPPARRTPTPSGHGAQPLRVDPKLWWK